MNLSQLARIDLNLLVLFDAVMQDGQAARAADRLNLTPSAISHGLTRLRRLLSDPLFLPTPKGMSPTARARELAAPIRDLLERAVQVLDTGAPFDPATSTRAFRIGAPDGALAAFLPGLLDTLALEAPGIDLRIAQLLPAEGRFAALDAWEPALLALDTQQLDLAVIPLPAAPARFTAESLFSEDFVVIAAQHHPFAEAPDLPTYLAARHLVVSMSGDPKGHIDEALSRIGERRRVALTVPNFHMALSVVAEHGILAAVPRRFALHHAKAHGLAVLDLPFSMPVSDLYLIAPTAALGDTGLAWLWAKLTGT